MLSKQLFIKIKVDLFKKINKTKRLFNLTKIKL